MTVVKVRVFIYLSSYSVLIANEVLGFVSKE